MYAHSCATGCCERLRRLSTSWAGARFTRSQKILTCAHSYADLKFIYTVIARASQHDDPKAAKLQHFLPPAPNLEGCNPRARWNAASLALLGDSVWEAEYHDRLLGSSLLTEEERDVMRWAGNSNAISPPKTSNSLEYKKASAVEVLVAYLYLTDADRLDVIMAAVRKMVPPNSGGKH